MLPSARSTSTSTDPISGIRGSRSANRMQLMSTSVHLQGMDTPSPVAPAVSSSGLKNWNAAAYENVRIIPVIRRDQPSENF